MEYNKIETYKKEVTFHKKNTGEIFVGFYDKKGNGHISPLFCDKLQPYFIFKNVRYNLNGQAITQLNKEFNYFIGA